MLKNPYSFLETEPQRQKAKKASFCSVLRDSTAGELKQTLQSVSVLVSYEKQSFGGQAETASPFLEVKEMGSCRWAVHVGPGKQWRRENS